LEVGDWGVQQLLGGGGLGCTAGVERWWLWASVKGVGGIGVCSRCWEGGDWGVQQVLGGGGLGCAAGVGRCIGRCGELR